MKLSDLLIHKKTGQLNNIVFEKKHIIFNDIKAVLSLNEWNYSEQSEFDSFIASYDFPNREEFKKKDKESVRELFPKPQVILKKNEKENEVRVAIALYLRQTLTGKTLLHLRSINKFEQMEIRYFLDFTKGPINDPKIEKRDFFEFCQSSDILFNYNFIGNLESNSARLRIVTLAFNEFIMLLYAFDKNTSLTQDELDSLINSFKKDN